MEALTSSATWVGVPGAGGLVAPETEPAAITARANAAELRKVAIDPTQAGRRVPQPMSVGSYDLARPSDTPIGYSAGVVR